MCQRVIVNGQYTGQTQEFADFLGVEPEELVWQSGEPESFGDYKFCLCPIDIEETADKFGYRCERTDYGDAVLTGMTVRDHQQQPK